MEAMGSAITLGTLINNSDYELALHAPFAEAQKDAIVAYGAELLVPFGLTYSCLMGRPLHCGTCSACQQRREAFIDAELGDPTKYEEQ